MTHYSEHLSIRPRQLWWMLAVAVAVVMAGSVLLLPFVLLAWCYSLLRYSKSEVRIDDYQVHVGSKSMPLAWFDPASLGQPRNVWPWFLFSSRRLSCVPFWTRSSVGLKGKNVASKQVWLSLGTNDRDALVAALLSGIQRAKASGATFETGAGRAAPGWYSDPWDPVRSLRWFDGIGWTGWTTPIPGRNPSSPWFGS